LASRTIIEKGKRIASDLLEVDEHDVVALYEDAATQTNPPGAKGCGEAGATGSPAAVVNAVVDAPKEFNIEDLDMPLTSAKIRLAAKQRWTGKDGVTARVRPPESRTGLVFRTLTRKRRWLY
jgi:hypothetical protein